MKKLFIIITIFFLSTNLYAAGGSSGGDGQESKQSNYKSAVNYVKAGKKLEKKGKIEKAKVKYEKAFKRLLKANELGGNNSLYHQERVLPIMHPLLSDLRHQRHYDHPILIYRDGAVLHLLKLNLYSLIIYECHIHYQFDTSNYSP